MSFIFLADQTHPLFQIKPILKTIGFGRSKVVFTKKKLKFSYHFAYKCVLLL